MNLLDAFQTLDPAAIQAWIAQEQEENVQLDFKRLNDPTFNRDDRINLAQAVSGFANSAGGLIVWGVDARRNNRNIDCAKGLILISPLQMAISKLTSLTGECTSPLVSGIQHRAITFEADKGCAVTLVPESANGPHMAKLSEDRYYKRSGDSFRKMEHFDLADMFGRRQRPDLSLDITVTAASEDGQLTFTFAILNTGRTSARHAGFHIWFPSGIVTINRVVQPLNDYTNLNSGTPNLSYAQNVGVIHPKGVRHLCGSMDISFIDTNSYLDIQGKLYCEQMKLKELKFSFENRL